MLGLRNNTFHGVYYQAYSPRCILRLYLPPLIQSTVYTAAGSYQAPNHPPLVAEGCPLYLSDPGAPEEGDLSGQPCIR